MTTNAAAPSLAVCFSAKYGPILSLRFVKCFDVVTLTMVTRFDILFGPSDYIERFQCPMAVERADVLNADPGQEITPERASSFISNCIANWVGKDFEFGEMVDFISAKPPYVHKAWEVKEKWAHA